LRDTFIGEKQEQGEWKINKKNLQINKRDKAQISLSTVQRPSLPLNPIPLAAPNPFIPAVIFFRGCILQSLLHRED
jgi:hypothetical protein